VPTFQNQPKPNIDKSKFVVENSCLIQSTSQWIQFSLYWYLYHTSSSTIWIKMSISTIWKLVSSWWEELTSKYQSLSLLSTTILVLDNLSRIIVRFILKMSKLSSQHTRKKFCSLSTKLENNLASKSSWGSQTLIWHGALSLLKMITCKFQTVFPEINSWILSSTSPSKILQTWTKKRWRNKSKKIEDFQKPLQLTLDKEIRSR